MNWPRMIANDTVVPVIAWERFRVSRQHETSYIRKLQEILEIGGMGMDPDGEYDCQVACQLFKCDTSPCRRPRMG